MTSRVGYWCDVCSHPSGIAFVYVTGPEGTDPNKWNTVICELFNSNGQSQILWKQTTSSTPRYLRCASSSDGNIVAVGQGQNGEGTIIIREDSSFTLYPQCYSIPGIRWNGNDFTVYIPITDKLYIKYPNTTPIDIPPEGTGSNGISQVTSPDGLREEIRWAKATRVRTINGYTLMVTMEYNGLVSGQYGESVSGIQLKDGSNPFIILDAPGMDPRLIYSNGKFGICSWTTLGKSFYNQFSLEANMALVPRVFSRAMLKDVGNGQFTVTIANPLEADFVFLPPKGTTLLGEGNPPVIGNDCVLSIQPDGAAQVRKKGTQGSWEKCKIVGTNLKYEPVQGITFLFPLAD